MVGIDEAQFYDLIRYRPAGGKLDEKQLKAKAKAEQQITEDAERMAREEDQAEKERKRKEKVTGRAGMAVK